MNSYKIKAQLWLLPAVLVPVACRSGKEAVSPRVEQSIQTVKIFQRDTVLTTEADSSFYKAWIECRDGKAVINPEGQLTRAGKYLSKPEVRIRENQLEVDCEAQARQLFRTWQQTYITEQKHSVITAAPEQIEKKLSSWQQIQIWIGRLTLFVLSGGLVFTLIRKYLNPFNT